MSKEYDEYDVWVWDEALHCKAGALYYREKEYAIEDNYSPESLIKATLRVPKPERKVTITEKELAEYCKRQSIGKRQTNYLIEEIFGRDA